MCNLAWLPQLPHQQTFDEGGPVPISCYVFPEITTGSRRSLAFQHLDSTIETYDDFPPEPHPNYGPAGEASRTVWLVDHLTWFIQPKGKRIASRSVKLFPSPPSQPHQSNIPWNQNPDPVNGRRQGENKGTGISQLWLVSHLPCTDRSCRSNRHAEISAIISFGHGFFT